MKYLLKYTLMLSLFVALSTALTAQKFGYLNSQALLNEMPEVKEAEANLQTLQKQLQAKGEQMLTDFQAKYVELERKNQQGEISPKELETESQKLQEQEQEIAQYEQQMQRQIMEKRNTLLQPILDRVNDAIKQVAEEDGYSYIFDASPGSGILLYVDESTDVMAQVKVKLGLE
jgi:outer membrane protein